MDNIKILLLTLFIYYSTAQKPIKKDLSSCKKLLTNYGYNYKTFYEISEFEQTTPNYILDLKFYIQAPNNAHILLTPAIETTPNAPVYEVVLGAGGNTFSDIRRKKGTSTKSTARIPNLLSVHEIKPFWLRLSKGGRIEVGEEGEQLAFLSWTDPDPLPIRYISFTTWRNVEALWYFDCRTNVSELTELPKNLTAKERLETDLFENYDSYIIPYVDDIDRFVIVLISFHNPKIIELDESKMSLEIEFDSNIKWIDPRLRWTKSTYENISTLYYKTSTIWVPPLHLFNAVGFGSNIVHQQYQPISIFYNGLIQWQPKVSMKAWCTDSDLRRWPHDQHSCNFSIGVYPYADKIRFSDNSSFGIKNFKEGFNAWKIVKVQSEMIEGKVIPGMEAEGLVENERYALTLRLTLQRANESMSNIFHSILLLIGIGSILTFCLPDKIKIGFSCFQLWLLVVTMLVILSKMPIKSATELPELVLFCVFGLITITLSLFVSILVIRINRNNHTKPLPRLLSWMVTSEIIQILFLLPKVKGDTEYDKMMRKMDVPDLWISLGVLIDRVMFLVMFILLSVYMGKYY